MARTATLSGRIRVSEDAVPPIIDTAISATTPTVTQQIEIESIQAASGGPTALSLGGLSNITMIYIAMFDNTTGAAKEGTLTVDAVALPACTNFLFVGNDTGVGVTSVSLTSGAGNSTNIKMIAAGT